MGRRISGDDHPELAVREIQKSYEKDRGRGGNLRPPALLFLGVFHFLRRVAAQTDLSGSAPDPRAGREAAAPSRGVRAFPEVAGVTHRFVDTPRLHVHVAEVGTGEPVVLLHGWPEHWWAWRTVIPLLADDYRIIAPDLRGFGWSDAPSAGYSTEELVDDLVGLLDALGLDEVLVIGHDVGGRLGFHLALREPNRVRRLVTLNALHPYWSFRRLAPQAWRFWWTVFVETPLLGRLVMRHVPAFTRMMLSSGVTDQAAMTPSEMAEFVASAREPARARASERLMYRFAYHEIIPTLLGRNRSRRLSVPTLMLNGTRDIQLSARSLGGYEPHVDDLRVELVTDAGHFLAEERPELVAASARAFFKRGAVR